MKRIMILLLAVILASTPLSVHAEKRDWWPTQVDEDDYYYNFDQIGKWPNDVTSIETMIETARIGNSVVPVMAKAIVEANCGDLKVGNRCPTPMTYEDKYGQVTIA